MISIVLKRPGWGGGRVGGAVVKSMTNSAEDFFDKLCDDLLNVFKNVVYTEQLPSHSLVLFGASVVVASSRSPSQATTTV